MTIPMSTARDITLKTTDIPWQVQHSGLVALVLTALGLSLRLLNLGSQSLWLDELFSMAVARGDWSQVIVGTAYGDTNPPLYNLLLHIVMQFGSTEVMVRSISVIVSTATIPLFFRVAQELFDPSAALWGTLFLVLSPLHVFFAQEARMYALLVFLSLSALWFFWQAWQRGDGLYWALFVLLQTLGLYTHSLAILNLLALDIFALTQKVSWSERWRGWLVSHLIILLLISPWLAVVLQQAGRVSAGFWATQPSLANLLFLPQLFLFGYATPRLFLPLTLFAGFTLLVLAALTIVRKDKSRPSVFLALSAFLLPVVTLFAISSIKPLFVEKTLGPASVGLYMLLGWSITTGRNRVPAIGLGTFTLVLLGISLAGYFVDPSFMKPPMREAAQYVKSNSRAGDIVLHSSDSSALAFKYYAADLPNHFLAGDPDYASQTTRAASGRISGLVPEPLAQVLTEQKRLWLVVALDHNIEYQMELVNEFDKSFVRENWQSVGGIDVFLYSLKR